MTYSSNLLYHHLDNLAYPKGASQGKDGLKFFHYCFFAEAVARGLVFVSPVSEKEI